MKCAICYEKILTRTSPEVFDKIEEMRNKNYIEKMELENLITTTLPTHTCHTANCECIICGNCWHKITNNGKSMFEVTVSDVPSLYKHFKCPYCRQIDWKDYMNNVFQELQIKVLGEEEFRNKLFELNFS